MRRQSIASILVVISIFVVPFMAYIAIMNRENLYKILLHERNEGVYVYVFESADSPYPEQDHLQDSLEQAMRFSERYFEVPRDLWEEVPDDPSVRP
ncbi:MAG: hypothetical protein IH830_10100 [Planctomycetes bacterium]|nr:hypothetical protein [Planctomycetota bacterium]